ncbi:putative quinol monooxygenase [Streptomyces sp. NPDC002701]|uniref:putative quinol monooxygenase n=1 Tax=Streptomyces sp. NPDC002701 TaxID=3364661 RepID=UPI00369C64DD
MIIIAGRVHVDPRDVTEFIAEAKATYPIAAANPGNVLLSFCIDDPDTGTVTVLEQWTSQKALAMHLSTPQVQQIFTKWAPRMRNEVRMFEDLQRARPPGLTPTRCEPGLGPRPGRWPLVARGFGAGGERGQRSRVGQVVGRVPRLRLRRRKGPCRTCTVRDAVREESPLMRGGKLRGAAGIKLLDQRRHGVIRPCVGAVHHYHAVAAGL